MNGENSFALYAGATGGTPRIYGIGAMQAFTPLSSDSTTVDTVSEFYLAQIDAVHAGKSVEIKLWDPGDTNPLRAELQILTPNSGGWAPTNLTWTAASGTPGSASCGASSWGSGPSIITNVGATGGTYNGCWLTIQIPIPGAYVADQEWLVEDPLQDEELGRRNGHLQRRHDLEGRDPREPGSPHRPVTGTNPKPGRPEEPRDHVLEVPRTAFGFKQVAILTIVVMIAATLLVIVLYMSPLAER